MKAHSLRNFLTLALLAGPLIAAEAPSKLPPSTSTPPTAAYTNNSDKSGWQPAQTSTVINTNAQFRPFNSARQTHDANFFNISTIQTYNYNKQVVHFPPYPVALGETTPSSPNLASPRGRAAAKRSTVLAIIAPYTSEIFYTALSTRVHDEEVSKKTMLKLSEYRTAKLKLVAELRAKLQDLRNAGSEQRKNELSQLAASMDPQILALENKAEEITTGLIKGGVFDSRINWDTNRSWRLGDDTRYETYQDEFLVMRAAAFLQEGLSIDQRLLLREITKDLQNRSTEATDSFSFEESSPYFSFSPFTARFRLPKEMPESLRASIAEYRELKSSIKQSLRQTIYEGDRALMHATRARAVAELKSVQTAAIATLEGLAEQIREGLANCVLPDEPQPAGLKGDLGDRIAKYLREKSEFQRGITNKLSELRALLPKDRIEIERDDAGVRIVITAARRSSKEFDALRAEALTNLKAYNRQLASTYMQIGLLREGLRLDVDRDSKQPFNVRSQTVDQLIKTFAESFVLQENWSRYNEYRTAVLEPGLSPAQRRLLYLSSLEQIMPDESK